MRTSHTSISFSNSYTACWQTTVCFVFTLQIMN